MAYDILSRQSPRFQNQLDIVEKKQCKKYIKNQYVSGHSICSICIYHLHMVSVGFPYIVNEVNVRFELS